MKASNKKRIESLEKTKTGSVSASVVIYDPRAPFHVNSLHGTGVCILIPDNGRMKYHAIAQAVESSSKDLMPEK
ncbi:MAG: hypothetical protein WCF19_04995 [Chlamydiales bacterium]